MLMSINQQMSGIHEEYFQVKIKFPADYSYLLRKASDQTIQPDRDYQFYVSKKVTCQEFVQSIGKEFNIPTYLFKLIHEGYCIDFDSEQMLAKLEARSQFNSSFYMLRRGNFEGSFLTEVDVENLLELRKVVKFNYMVQDILTSKKPDINEAINSIFQRFLYFKMNFQGTFKEASYSVILLDQEKIYYRYQNKNNLIRETMWLSKKLFLSKHEAQQCLAIKDEWNGFSSVCQLKLSPGAWVIESKSRAQGNLAGGDTQILFYADDEFNQDKFEIINSSDTPFPFL